MGKPKLMVIGLDSVSLSLLDHYHGSVPNLRKLMGRGMTGRAIPCFPIYTPTNWAALSTGAEPAITHAAAWSGDGEHAALSTFDRRAIQCDTIFDAAARAKLRTLTMCYPSGYPVAGRGHMTLAPLDRGLTSNCLVPGKIVETAFDSGGVFAFQLLDRPAALSGAAMAKAVGATEDGASVTDGRKRKVALKPILAHVFKAGRGRWRLGFSGDPARANVPLAHERWSEPIAVKVAAGQRPGNCVVRVMVFDRGRRLAVSEAYDIGMLGAPASLAKEAYRRFGPPTEHSVFYKQMNALFHDGREDAAITRLAKADLTAQADWIADAAGHVQKARGFDIFYLHHHYPDSVLHEYLAASEGAKGFTAAQHALARKAIRMSLEICDGLVGRLVALAGAGTTVLAVSDHGNVPNRYVTNLAKRLVETGLMVLNRDGAVSKSRSRAVPGLVWTWIDVNAPRGSRRYERIQREVIDALLDWKAPDGERAVAAALKRKDAHLLGYDGEHCGDVVYHYNSGFSWFGGESIAANLRGANHGPQMPVTFSKTSDNMSFFVLAGPKVRRGARWDEGKLGHVQLKDLVPTICHCSGVPAPRDASGAVRCRMLK